MAIQMKTASNIKSKNVGKIIVRIVWKTTNGMMNCLANKRALIFQGPKKLGSNLIVQPSFSIYPTLYGYITTSRI